MKECNCGFKNCFLSFRNKKISAFCNEEGIISRFSERGYWFDNVSFIAFDSPREISYSVKFTFENYESIIILCPKEMESALKQLIGDLSETEFDNFGVLNCSEKNVFIIYSDFENRITVDDICNLLNKKYKARYETAYIKTVGVTVTEIDGVLSKVRGLCDSVSFGIEEKFGDCTLKIIYEDDTPKVIYDNINRIILGDLNKYVYAIENISLAERLVQLLKVRRMKICVAESFTGGGVGKRIVEVPGASEVFYEGLNTYSNQSKSERLGVHEITLKHYGAVSKETAYEMAEGLLKTGNCDVCIATTGIAGPNSDNTRKPVGLAYIAVGLKDGIFVYDYNLKGSRETITQTAINLALFLAYRLIK